MEEERGCRTRREGVAEGQACPQVEEDQAGSTSSWRAESAGDTDFTVECTEGKIPPSALVTDIQDFDHR